MSEFFTVDKNMAADGYIETSTNIHFINPNRKPIDFPNLSLLEVDLPEYKRAGLGHALLRVMRYKFTNLDTFAVEGAPLCASSSRKIMIYEDMNPVWVGNDHKEAQANSGAPKEVLQILYQGNIPMEFVTLGALRHWEYKEMYQLAKFIQLYYEKASEIEANPARMMFENIAAREQTV
jgi:hypothetical protein